MKPLHATLFILGVLLSMQGSAQQAILPEADQHNSSGEAAVLEETPAQQRIVAAKQQIATDPKRVQAYNELALASLRRTRETADPRYLKDADAALAQGLKLDPEDFQLQKTQVALQLSRHEFAHARDRATALHRRTPDDVTTYGYLAEAYIGLGDYPQAEINAQWTQGILQGMPVLMDAFDADGRIVMWNAECERVTGYSAGEIIGNPGALEMLY